MANSDDVLERAARWIDACEKVVATPRPVAIDYVRDLIGDLTAEVRKLLEKDARWQSEMENAAKNILRLTQQIRELRRDRARLEFALRMGPLLLVENDGNGMLVRSWDVEDRADIDAAMGGGEGEA